MNRLFTTTVAEATGPAASLFASIKGAIGMVPNAFLTAGSNSPVALGAALALDGTLHNASLSVKEIEVIKLAVSEYAQCDYCIAAHTAISKKAGLSREAILGYRHAQPSGDERLDALAVFARYLVSTTGTVPAEVVTAVKQAGYGDDQIVDTILAVASITFTNLLNRVNDTPVDFPAAD